MAVTSGNHDDGHPRSQPWHNRTPAVVGASVVALAVIGVLVLAVTFVSRQMGEPEQAPLNYVEPTFSATATQSGTATTTQTITSTSPPETTEIGGPLEPPTTPTTPSTTSSSETTSESATTEEDDDDEDEETTERTTRRGPRTNVTRTFSPLP